MRVFKSRILWHFWEFESRFFHFKVHCWSGVWTENSKKNPDVFLSTPNYRINFRWIPLRRTSLIAFFTNETFRNHVFSTWNLIPRAGCKRKLLKKIPDVSLCSINRWYQFQIFSLINCWNSRLQTGIYRTYELIQEICQRIPVLWACNYQNRLVPLLRQTTFTDFSSWKARY